MHQNRDFQSREEFPHQLVSFFKSVFRILHFSGFFVSYSGQSKLGNWNFREYGSNTGFSPFSLINHFWNLSQIREISVKSAFSQVFVSEFHTFKEPVRWFLAEFCSLGSHILDLGPLETYWYFLICNFDWFRLNKCRNSLIWSDHYLIFFH